ncbi:MAG: ferrous iron transport protein B [Firmicutes bacterium]|nr:ferrous iron transport protein B [Bacillota bacterium]
MQANIPVIAIAGNPNSGKTALFNAITGSRQHVGNWPGVTVEKKEGLIRQGDQQALLVDLPGTYAFSSRALDETIARDFIVNQHPDVVINVVDSTHLERNLYLTLQLLEMDVPVIVALNMFDEAESLNLQIDIQQLSRLLGTEVIPTVAIQGKGIEQLVRSAMNTALTDPDHRNQGIPSTSEERVPYKLDYGTAIEAEITLLEEYLAKTSAVNQERYWRWHAIKLLEMDAGMRAQVESQLDKSRTVTTDTLETRLAAAQARIRTTLEYEPIDLITEKRYDQAAKIAQAVIRAGDATVSSSYEIDKIMLHPWLAYPIFLGVIWMMFRFTFTLSQPLADWFVTLFEALGTIVRTVLTGHGVPQMLVDFLVEGIIAGLGAVLEFAPPIFLLFFVISILEDIGYMARAALLSDRLMQAVGLHGRAFVPMILGFGCNVTGILATRSLDSPRDRLISILVNPLISCAGRLPIYVLFATAFFKGKRTLVVFSLYILGVLLAALAAKVLSLFIEPDTSSTFVLELPPYRVPRLSAVLTHTWERGKEFLHKAGTVILLAVALVWFLANMPPGTGPGSPDSFIGRIGTAIAPVLRPAGFGTWEAAVALMFGVVAKELIIGTLGVLYGASDATLLQAIQQAWSPLSAYAFMVMTLVYIPCVATIASIRRETDSWKWTAVAVAYTLVLGWILAVVVYQVGMLIGLG